MKKIIMTIAVLSVAMFAPAAGAVAQDKPDFAGTWTLDKSKTREVPAGLTSYLLIVKQDAEQISFEAKIEGNVNPAAAPDDTRTSSLNTFGESTTSSSGTGTGSTGVAGSAFGDTGSMSSSSKVHVAHGRAFSTIVRRMTCRLDGQEHIREIGGLSPGRMHRKATWKVPGKVLELNIARDFDTPGSKFTSTVREQWELADGGKELRVKRTVNLLAGWDEVTLVFNRQ